MKAKLILSCRKCCAILMLCVLSLHIASAASCETEAIDADFPNLYLLEAQDAAFPPGQRYAVYSGPGEDYLRGADGKAAVSTSGPIQAFARENGWMMIEYAIDQEHHRIGWIQEKSDSLETSLHELPPCDGSATLEAGAGITDDPLYSQAPLITFPMDIYVYVLARLDDWIYIESDTGDCIRGFVRKSQLTPGKVYELSQQSDSTLAFDGHIVIDRDSLFVDMKPVVWIHGLPESIVSVNIYDSMTNQLLMSVSEWNEENRLVGSGWIPESTSSLRLVPVDADGNEIKTDGSFVMEW